MNEKAPQTLIVTGLSGAGMSTTLKVLEDLGYEVFDNFPLSMISHLLSENTGHPVAIGIDTRTRGFDPQGVLEYARNLDAGLLFLTCDADTLQKRFTETRRRHPGAIDRTVSDGIAFEMDLLAPLKEHGDPVIDTTKLSIHDLRHILEGFYGSKERHHLSLTVMSFGFKNGIPREADIIWDVRFLKNPHWDENLKPLTGLDPKIGEYIEQDASFNGFFENLTRLLDPLLPRYLEEGKHYLTIALGCTGGRHRSVYITEKLAAHLKTAHDHAVSIRHRDIA